MIFMNTYNTRCELQAGLTGVIIEQRHDDSMSYDEAKTPRRTIFQSTHLSTANKLPNSMIFDVAASLGAGHSRGLRTCFTRSDFRLLNLFFYVAIFSTLIRSV